jgi:hypothetical protein
MPEDKKFTLDELPDEGSEPKNRAPQKILKKIADPRIERLKGLDDSSKVSRMGEKWYFDEREKTYNWTLYVLALSILEFSPVYETYLQEIHSMNDAFFEIGGEVIREATIFFEAFIKHPFILILLTPVFFRFSKASPYQFSIGFDGIDTVRSFLSVDSKDLVSRVLIKWKEINRVEKTLVGNKEILRLFSSDGHIADLIWYISIEKKRAIKMLLSGMIIPQHPMREFLDKKKELL